MPLFQEIDTTMRLLQKTLDLRSDNQGIIASNIANADTPGYLAKTMSFEKELGDALAGNTLKTAVTNPAHIPVSPPDIEHVTGRISTTPDTTGIGDGNSVNIDEEMVSLSKNEILYEAAANMLNSKLAMIKYAANDGQ